MNGPAEDIARLIAAQSLATFAGTTGWSVSTNIILEEPDTLITVIDVGGLGPIDTLTLDEVDNWTVQIRVRGTGSQAVRDKIDAIIAAINLKKDHEVVDGATTIGYIVMYRSTLPEFLGADERNRPIFAFNMSGLRAWN